MRKVLASGMWLLVLAAGTVPGGVSMAQVTVVQRPAAEAGNDFYVGNRPPLLPSPFSKLPAGTVRPGGWVRKQLELQAAGFHGHLTEISSFLKREGNAWLAPAAGSHAGWEEVPYWLKGFLNCAYLVGDEAQMREAKVWIEAALASGRDDGWFGPESNLTRHKGSPDLWPNMIMQFCLQDYYDFTGDKRVITLLRNYCRYLATIPDAAFLPGYWDRMRGGDLLFSVYWVYNRTGDAELLDLAAKVHRSTARWDEDVINWHNVNIAQAFGEPGTWYQQSKSENDLRAAYRNWAKVRELYGQVPGGMFGGDENCRRGHDGPRQAIETCGIVEEMLSDETLLTICGDPLWADRCEDAAFNSLPAALTADLKALRYLTAPNMVLSDRRSKSPGLQNGGPMLHMNPHSHRCCQHNWGHGWPYYAEHLFVAAPGNGLAAVLYAPCSVTAKAGDGAEVTITEQTHYPFAERVEFSFAMKRATTFPFFLRVPGWCRDASLSLNGKVLPAAATPRSYLRVERRWEDGDRLVLSLPMAIGIRHWEKNRNTVSVDRGPLTYSLLIGEDYVRQGGTDRWPAWEIHPTTPWNYGLVLQTGEPAASFRVETRPWPASEMPFTHDGSPILLHAKGRRIPNWRLDALGLVGAMQPGPIGSAEAVEDITLVPMGAARLRIAAFPLIGNGPEAKDWPPAPPPPPFKASHCFEGDTVAALGDGIEPKNSNDHSIPRFTWWDRRGSTEWVEYDFNEPRRVSAVEVYWFDDTGVGQCRVPASWRILYRRGGGWQPVTGAGDRGTAKDTYNQVSFEAVTTAALRLEVTLQDTFSGGILEWRVK